MDFVLVFLVTAALSVALAGALKKVPWLFYGLAVVAVAVLVAGLEGLIGGGWWKPLLFSVKRCMVPLAMFAVVMFVGVLPRGSWLDARLRPVRAELSIVACILCLGHMCVYIAPYAMRAIAGSLDTTTLVSFIVAVVLFALVIVLGVTSFSFVKHRMGGRTWKNVQRLAYPFFGLAWVHLMFMLAPAAALGGEQAVMSVVIYTLVFAAYLVLRLFRAYRDRQAEAESAVAGSQVA